MKTTAASTRICPVEGAGMLDHPLRRLFQNPRKIVAPHLREGLRVLEVGCGPGYFTVSMAQLVGASGSVTAVDLQSGMIERLTAKITGTAVESRIHSFCGEVGGLEASEHFDFAFLFYMVHEVPDARSFFREIAAHLAPSGTVLVVEPPIHVSRQGFERTLAAAQEAGLTKIASPRLFPNHTALLGRA